MSDIKSVDLYSPKKNTEHYAIDVVFERGVCDLLIRYPYKSKDAAQRAFDELKNQNKFTKSDFTPIAFFVVNGKTK